mmetsp:Transcript_14388/g.40104  ORF Transcript_14388/g.40104 Transcript_14388/m.40104 type:complete len:81 (-) Transcript_14388:106-348(-)
MSIKCLLKTDIGLNRMSSAGSNPKVPLPIRSQRTSAYILDARFKHWMVDGWWAGSKRCFNDIMGPVNAGMIDTGVARGKD